MVKTTNSETLFDTARVLLPGGVDSPVRAFKAVGGTPLFIDRGEGPYLFDVDGNRFIDYVLSWGPLILGHAHPSVVAAIAKAAALGTSFGAPHASEIRLAQLIREFMPGIEKLRFVNSGTEAVMSAIRLARAHVRRNRIIKFEGNYHGHSDALLVRAGSGIATLGLPDSPGVPPGAVADTLVARYNDLGSVERLFAEHPDEIAAVILEPVAGNMGVVSADREFLLGLRKLTQKRGALLIFDEVMSGFRVHPGGAQTLYGIAPDLTTLGKVIGGGLPVGAYGGRRDIMGLIAPEGPVYQAGTLSGNPLAMAAGIATLEVLKAEPAWDRAARRCDELARGITAAAAEAGVAVRVPHVGTMFSVFFTDRDVRDWDEVKACDTEVFRRYFHAMLEAGVYLAPSPFEAGFVSAAHGEQEIRGTVEAARLAFVAESNAAKRTRQA
ncbi:MAG TPA: glutamate-1-semialdehyde 2,1-aminomutase [Spirochaetia bacterium]|nr:glutamate-1-semialdehyde 2,1-aminomutase [Spirochaetia bacterium]